MTAASIHGFEVQASPEIVQHWGWFLAFGIGLLALGVAAVMRSVTATIVSCDDSLSNAHVVSSIPEELELCRVLADRVIQRGYPRASRRRWSHNARMSIEIIRELQKAYGYDDGSAASSGHAIAVSKKCRWRKVRPFRLSGSCVNLGRLV